CLRLLLHWARRAASRAACTAGSSSAINTAMMAITTSNSIRVKALHPCRFFIFNLEINGPNGLADRSTDRRSNGGGDGRLEWPAAGLSTFNGGGNGGGSRPPNALQLPTPRPNGPSSALRDDGPGGPGGLISFAGPAPSDAPGRTGSVAPAHRGRQRGPG